MRLVRVFTPTQGRAKPLTMQKRRASRYGRLRSSFAFRYVVTCLSLRRNVFKKTISGKAVLLFKEPATPNSGGTQQHPGHTVRYTELAPDGFSIIGRSDLRLRQPEIRGRGIREGFYFVRHNGALHGRSGSTSGIQTSGTSHQLSSVSGDHFPTNNGSPIVKVTVNEMLPWNDVE